MKLFLATLSLVLFFSNVQGELDFGDGLQQILRCAAQKATSLLPDEIAAIMTKASVLKICQTAETAVDVGKLLECLITNLQSALTDLAKKMLALGPLVGGLLLVVLTLLDKVLGGVLQLLLTLLDIPSISECIQKQPLLCGLLGKLPLIKDLLRCTQ
ncbi:hypothetical protein PPYR_14654 [Photinus pyralis]|uniref:Uncharacterized protein n=1 Tax=Photinus pyralis TaxID=7054 RepID=A0A5N4A5U5_PHOPY|nr:uncharacterized protein LOC116181006 [Photinus pyralis]KAB0792695.1 hypothetical protein PPYR_14654 [Photinus pyralis]